MSASDTGRDFRATAHKYAPAAVLLVWFSLLTGLLGRWAWPFDVFANFRVHYFVLFVLLTLVLLMVDRKRMAFLSVAGAAVAAIPLFAYVTPPGRAAEASPESFRLVTFNVWYRNDEVAEIASYLESTRADVIVLEELPDDRVAALRALLPTYPHARVESGELGVVTLSKWPIVKSQPVPLSSQVNGSLVTLDWHGRPVNLLGLHLHWPLGFWSAPQREQELRSIAKFVAAFGEPLLVAGDFNLTPWSPHFTRLLRDGELIDGALGHGLMPSWPSQFRWIGIRIDHCLMTRQWQSVRVETGPHVGSDHRPLVADLQLMPLK